MKFSEGQKVYFRRNSACYTDNTPVIAVDKENKCYVVENSFGWNPEPVRTKQYRLDKNKKYLLVHESELKDIATYKKDLQKEIDQEEKRQEEIIEFQELSEKKEKLLELRANKRSKKKGSKKRRK